MAAWTTQNGVAWTSCEGVPPDDRGFRYGMAVFETLLVRRGFPMFVEEHLERLRWASDTCRFPAPKIDPDGLRDLIFAAGVPEDSVVRLYVTAGLGAPLDPATSPGIYVLADGRIAPKPGAPLRIGLRRTHSQDVFAGVKSANYWGRIRLLHQVRDEGFDEGVLVGTCDSVSGCIMGNLIVQRGGQWLTPAAQDGARPGVVRAWVGRHLHVEECPLVLGDIEDADRALYTNSRLGPCAIGSLGDRHLDTPVELSLLTEAWESDTGRSREVERPSGR